MATQNLVRLGEVEKHFPGQPTPLQFFKSPPIPKSPGIGPSTAKGASGWRRNLPAGPGLVKPHGAASVSRVGNSQGRE